MNFKRISKCCLYKLGNTAFISFRDLIEKMKENDIWDLDAFSSLNHNCQHFCAKAIKILGAEYNDNGITIRNNERLKKGKKIDIIPEAIRNVLLENN